MPCDYEVVRVGSRLIATLGLESMRAPGQRALPLWLGRITKLLDGIEAEKGATNGEEGVMNVHTSSLRAADAGTGVA